MPAESPERKIATITKNGFYFGPGQMMVNLEQHPYAQISHEIAIIKKAGILIKDKPLPDFSVKVKPQGF